MVDNVIFPTYVLSIVVPADMVNVPVPRAVAELILSWPAESITPPEAALLLPESVNVPADMVVRPV